MGSDILSQVFLVRKERLIFLFWGRGRGELKGGDNPSLELLFIIFILRSKRLY